MVPLLVLTYAVYVWTLYPHSCTESFMISYTQQYRSTVKW